ncbi:probable formaldehyde dehydrogenase AdhA [Tigriopus californicus]|uniref:probable formaldehyde dehydrogenase AdhA n=1 Tax=Tigriopus californicus TaxID=6832 RepID=UPI0027DA2CC0|nr:probable formaldehyde dehydrogenase AdhA [Tigriopus californicus]
MSTEEFYETWAFAKSSKEGEFEKIKIARGETGPDDVEFDIKFCGICHSDVHIAQDELQPFMKTKYPCVPGHELAGVVTKVGSNVSKFKVGDKVGVGCIVEACLKCEQCQKGCEEYCLNGHTMTYNSDITHNQIRTKTGYTFGGYSQKTTIRQDFIIKVPDSYPLEQAGPVFCAGITMFSPLKHWGALKGGINVGIVGVGGLGQMGIRLAAAMGCKVTAISTSPKKEAAAKSIGASNFVVSSDPKSIAGQAKTLDLILDTVSVSHDINPYLSLLRVDGTMVMIGAALEPQQIRGAQLMFTRNSVAGSIIGGIGTTQECIDFCAKNDIKPSIELITADKLGKVYETLLGKNDSIVRFVLDIDASV